LPGVGTSIGLTRLFWQLREIGLIKSDKGGAAVLVTVMDEEGVGYALAVARTLREAGFNTETVMEPGRLGNQLKFADRAGIRFVVIAGSEERAEEAVTVRDLRAQTQVKVARQEAVGHLQSQSRDQG
jgi:histidyl-tRNA synthetase